MRTETTDLVRLLAVRSSASMEPSSVEDGNENGSRTVSPSLLASMEPSSVEDGNIDVTPPPALLPEPLQWSRPQLRTETCVKTCTVSSSWAGFNGAVLS